MRPTACYHVPLDSRNVSCSRSFVGSSYTSTQPLTFCLRPSDSVHVNSASCFVSVQICVGKNDLDCMDVEIKDDRPAPATPREALPDNKSREMCFENDVLRAYRVTLAPGQGISGSGKNKSIGIPCLFVALSEAKLSTGVVRPGDRWWVGLGATVGVNGREANEGDTHAEIMVLEPK